MTEYPSPRVFLRAGSIQKMHRFLGLCSLVMNLLTDRFGQLFNGINKNNLLVLDGLAWMLAQQVVAQRLRGVPLFVKLIFHCWAQANI